ncbi:MAG: HEAT repeat domain-containing protein [bacterium]
MKKTLILAALLGAVGFSSVANAQSLEAIQNHTKADRETNKDAWDAVATLRAQMKDFDARKRGRVATVGTMLDDIGPEGLYPMMNELIVDAPFEQARPSVRQGWRIGLLFALGRLRNPETRPVLEHVLRTEKDVAILGSASEALGKLQDEQAARVLIELSAGNSARSLAILKGAGQCRRQVMADYLAARLPTASAAEFDNTVEALRDVGNAWAWSTDVVAASGEGDVVRSAAASALLSAWITNPEKRNDLRKALLIVDAPNMNTLVVDASKSVTAKDRDAFNALKASLDANPLHKRK